MRRSIWHDGPPSLETANAMSAGCLNERLGIEFVAAGDDWIRARMPVDERTRQPFGRLHGGASVALAETLGSWAGICTLDSARNSCVGLEINANHLRAVRDGWVHGEARPESLGRRIQVWTIRITDDGGRAVCVARLTLAVIEKVDQ